MNSLFGVASIGNLTPTRGRRRIELAISSETGGQAAPRLRRTMTLTDLLLNGIVIVSPVAPMTIFGVMSERGQGHVIAAVLIAMVASLLTGLGC